jgi:GAF domain-containing protein
VLEAGRLARDASFSSMLDAVLEAFQEKIGDLLDAERASLLLVDLARGELWSKCARDAAGERVEIHLPLGAGIAGSVAQSGEALNLPDAWLDPRFDRRADESTGHRTRSLLCVPLRARDDSVFAVAQLLNKHSGAFDAADEERFAAFMRPMSVILETWWRIGGSAGVKPE